MWTHRLKDIDCSFSCRWSKGLGPAQQQAQGCDFPNALKSPNLIASSLGLAPGSGSAADPVQMAAQCLRLPAGGAFIAPVTKEAQVAQVLVQHRPGQAACHQSRAVLLLRISEAPSSGCIGMMYCAKCYYTPVLYSFFCSSIGHTRLLIGALVERAAFQTFQRLTSLQQLPGA